MFNVSSTMLCSCCHPRPNQPQVKIQSPWTLATDFQHSNITPMFGNLVENLGLKEGLAEFTEQFNKVRAVRDQGMEMEWENWFIFVWCGEVMCPHMVGWKLTMFRLQAWLSQHLTTSVTSLLCIIQDAKTTIANTQFAKDALLDVRSSLSHRWMTAKTTN